MFKKLSLLVTLIKTVNGSKGSRTNNSTEKKQLISNNSDNDSWNSF